MLCAVCDLFSLSPPLFSFALSLSFFCLRALHPAHGFCLCPPNLFLPLQNKCYVRGLCFLPSPSQRIYDVPAVCAISQRRGVHCRSELGWTFVPGVHHKHFRLVYTFSPLISPQGLLWLPRSHFVQQSYALPSTS